MVITTLSVPIVGHAEEKIDLAPEAKSAILIDAATGTVLFEKDADKQLPPASITKMMTMLLVVEAIERKTMKWSDQVSISEHAASMGGSQIFLEPGEQMSVSDLFKGIALASGNDASVAIAEKVAGSETLFVNKMNERAKELGLKNTHFVNTNGLPVANHYSSARDIAMIGKALVQYPEVLKYTGKYQGYLRENTKEPFWLVNTNKLIRFYKGADGLKTGYTGEAKYCIAATAKRGNVRVIAVVLGEPSSKIRNAETSKLMDYAFSQFASKVLIHKGDMLGTVRVAKGEPQTLKIRAMQDYTIFAQKDQLQSNKYRYELKWKKTIWAPLKKGQVIGHINVYQGDTTVKKYTVTSPQTVKQTNLWIDFKRLFFQLTMTKSK
jgi:D-alanyl-D-alanine carboxypeptidase (penicillin-binding protein 5/6)